MKMRFSLLIVAVLGLLLVACTRSATTPAVPPTQDASGVGGGSADPTMDALGTQLAATQTLAAGQPPAGVTPEVPLAGTATPTQIVAQATVTPTVTTATPIAPTAVAAACASPYTVKQGDWIYKIARECKLDPRAVIAANPGINPNRLTPGQKINLPGGPTATPVPGGPTATPVQACKGTYTVKAGDNLFRIAFNCGYTTEQMAGLNNIPAPYRIFPGQVLRYP